jgi:hypothetical protein
MDIFVVDTCWSILQVATSVELMIHRAHRAAPKLTGMKQTPTAAGKAFGAFLGIQTSEQGSCGRGVPQSMTSSRRRSFRGQQADGRRADWITEKCCEILESSSIAAITSQVGVTGDSGAGLKTYTRNMETDP